MHSLKLLFSTIAGLLLQAWRLPVWLVRLLRFKRQQSILNAREAERLDRIRHPEKYLGK
jgi:HD-like signal output (HDOD) protein